MARISQHVPDQTRCTADISVLRFDRDDVKGVNGTRSTSISSGPTDYPLWELGGRKVEHRFQSL
jgi:hypothetical protein